MQTSESVGEICQTCHKTHPWADGTMPRHAFNDGTLGGFQVTRPQKATVQQAPWPFDPVLRQALIDKGILTPEDLTAAEAKIRAVTAQLMGGTDGTVATPASGA